MDFRDFYALFSVINHVAIGILDNNGNLLIPLHNAVLLDHTIDKKKNKLFKE